MKTLIFSLLILLMLPLNSYAKHIVFLGDSNTALNYLNPLKNPKLNQDLRFTSLITNPRYPQYYIRNSTSSNTAVGGAKTRDFLPNGKYYNQWAGIYGDIFVVSFGLNDAPQDVPETRQDWANLKRAQDTFYRQTVQLTNHIKERNPHALVYLMTNVDLDYKNGNFQYNRNILVDSFDNVYRSLTKSTNLRLIDVNTMLKAEIQRGNSDLRVRRSNPPVLDASQDRSRQAISLGRALWRSNIHYNINGSKTVAKIIHRYLNATAAE